MSTTIKRTPPVIWLTLLTVCIGCLTNSAIAKQVAAVSVDTFIDSMGVNIHHLDTDERTWITDLGFRHIRDNSNAYPGSSDETALTELYNTFGIKTGFIARTQWAISQQVLFSRNAFVDWVEGINEPDGANPAITYNGLTDRDSGSTDFDATVAFQNDLYAALKADPQTAALQVLSPAMANVVNLRYLTGASLNTGAVHYYPAGRQPIGGPGGLVLETALNDALFMRNPRKDDLPLIITEAGYHTYINQPGHPGITETAYAKYAPRIFTEFFRRGIQRTYLYQLRDDPAPIPANPPLPMEYYFGLVDSYGNKRAPYWRIKNMITLLSDTTSWNGSAWNYPSFTPGALDYTLTGETQNVRQLLLQKSNGEFHLLLWQEVNSHNTTTHTDIINPDAAVTLNLNTPISLIETYLLDSTSPKASYANPRSITLNVPDEVMIVKLVPRSIHFPWSQADIGPVGITGSSKQEGNIFTIKASGQDMFSTVDQFRYTYQKLHGDGSIIARIVSMDNTGGSARAGLMMRETTDAGSKHVSIFLRPGEQRAFHYRATTNGNAQTVSTSPIAGPYWFKLARTGNTLKGYYSSDATNWTLAGTQTITMNWEILVGFAVTSATNYQLCTAVIDHTYISHQQVSVKPTDASAREGASPMDSGSFTISREGYIYTPITVPYSLVGSATSGSDYTSGSMIANFPAGVPSIQVPIDPVNDAMIESDKSVVIKLQSGGNYSLTDNWQAQSMVYDDEKIATFEAATLPSGWTSEPRSTLAVDTGTFDPAGGSRSMRWTYNDNDVDRWGNAIKYDFPTAQDWQWANKIKFRFASSTGVSGKNIYFNIRNNGVAPTSSGIAYFHTAPTADFQDVIIDLTPYARDQITQIFFYVDGADYPGSSSGGINHVFHIDQISLLNHVDVADFENNDLSLWTGQPRSTLAVDSNVLDSTGGDHALKWTFNADGSAWGNEIRFTPTSAQDWAAGKTLKFRLACASSQLAGKHIFLNLANNGVVYSSSGIGNYVLPGDTLYHDVTIPLANVPRDLVTQLRFYVYGTEFSTGDHVFYIDNIHVE